MKKTITFFLTLVILFSTAGASAAKLEMDSDTEDVPASVFLEGALPANIGDIPAPSALLMEKETGEIIFEKNADERLEPASLTKIMTILLIVEAMEAELVAPDDLIPVSAYAASMGGSQVYLEEGEKMTARDMLKAIVVSSANDASVAMAEYLYGTEAAFASEMNARAVSLGMANTYFTNCTGLLNHTEHLSSARDVAIMSRELIKHDMVKEYSTIWMDTLRDGAFGLANTNKLIYYYDGATGLKTGFTKRAGYCLSATALRDGVEYIAVVMHCATSAERFESCKSLLSYAFANFTLTETIPSSALPPIPVTLGVTGYVQPMPESMEPLLVKRSSVPSITRVTELADGVKAPVCVGDPLGVLKIYDGGTLIAEMPIIAADDVARLTFGQIFVSLAKLVFAGG